MALRGLREAAMEAQRLLPLRWDMMRRYRLPGNDIAQPYYLSWDPGNELFGERWTEFDESGILRNGGYYNAVSIAQYALHCYELLCGGDAGSREPFLKHAEYLLRAQRGDGMYVYENAFPQYGVRPGWYSCMAQGEASSVLLRAYALTSDFRYLDGALRALEPLERDVSADGASIVRGDVVFFEEIAQQPCHILNGHLYAAFAVWEMCAFGFAPQSLRDLHEASIRTLLRWLPQYDARGWSYYQLAARAGGERHFATLFYHQTHIAQLDIYAAMTGRPEFRDMSRRWRAGLHNLGVRARVWMDIGDWAGHLLRRRAGFSQTTPWRSIMLEGNE